MCGACGTAVADWAVPLVSGPRRRAELARFVTGVCRGVRVRTVDGGWTSATMTGSTRVAQTLDALLDQVAPRLAHSSWAELESALAPWDGEPEAHDDYLPPPAAAPEPAATTVLTVPAGAGLHLWLAAFGLGVRAFTPAPVALDAVHRRAPLRLLAAHGRILGAAAA